MISYIMETTVVNFKGFDITCITTDFVAHSSIMQAKEWEPHIMTFIKKYNSIYGIENIIDVGANFGYHTLFFSRETKGKVFAFEPSVFNLELLARNIYLNQLTADIAIVPVALSHDLGISMLNMTSTEWGGALSTFGQDYGWDGKQIKQVFNYELTIERAICLRIRGTSGISNSPSSKHGPVCSANTLVMNKQNTPQSSEFPC